MHYATLTSLLLAVSTPVFGVAAEQPTGARFVRDLQAGKKVVIVTMGTSLTGGTWRWPDVMMNDWLNKDFPGQATLFNEGVGASSTAVGPAGNQKLSGLGKLSDVLARKPDVIFIEFGTNDAYVPYKTSLAESKRNLNKIIDAIQAADPKTEIVLQTMNSCKDKPGVGLHATNRPQIAAYFQLYRDVARERNLLLVDHYPNWLKIMTTEPDRFDQLVPDRIHPQAEGYRTVLLPQLKAKLMPPADMRSTTPREQTNIPSSRRMPNP